MGTTPETAEVRPAYVRDAAGNYYRIGGGGGGPHTHVEADLPTTLATDTEVATAVANHVAAANPHPVYQTDSQVWGTVNTGVANHEAAADPHTVYQKESEKAAVNGYASLDGTTKVPVAQLPTGSSVGTVAIGNHNHSGIYDPAGTAASAVTTHAGAADPHTGYQLESEKNAANGYAGLDAGTKVAFAQMPTGVASNQVAIGTHSHSGIVTDNRQVIAGTGLTGGGALTADVTLNVIGGTGITVAADAVSADTSVLQARSEKNAVSGYAGLDTSAKVNFGNLPTGTDSSTVAVGNAAAGLITTHEAAADPHTGYVLANGTRPMTGDLNVNSATIKLDAPGTAAIIIDRQAVTNYGHFEFRTNGVQKWTVGTRANEGDDFSIFGTVNRPVRIDAGTSLVTLYGDPTAALGAATKQYVDNRVVISASQPGSPTTGMIWVQP